jgi:hypothetical protein
VARLRESTPLIAPSVVHQTELVPFWISHHNPSSPGIHDFVSDTRGSKCDQPIAFGMQVVTYLDVDVKPVLARCATLGHLLEDELWPGRSACRNGRPVLLERSELLVAKCLDPEVAERVDIVGIEHDVNRAKGHTHHGSSPLSIAGHD